MASGDEFKGMEGWQTLEDTSEHRLEVDATEDGFVLIHDSTDPMRVIRTTLTSLERLARPVAAGNIPQQIRQRARSRQSQR
jgi:hypothetical protein